MRCHTTGTVYGWSCWSSSAGSAVCLVAFVVALNQFPALLGEKGLLPACRFVRRVPFRRAPSLFHWRCSDGFARVLAGLNRATLKLLAHDPWPERPPRFIRASYYRYRFADRRERKATGAYWQRTKLGEYLPAVGVSSFDEG